MEGGGVPLSLLGVEQVEKSPETSSFLLTHFSFLNFFNEVFECYFKLHLGQFSDLCPTLKQIPQLLNINQILYTGRFCAKSTTIAKEAAFCPGVRETTY